MKVISKKVTKKALDMIIDLSKDEEKYTKFWAEFGRSMKFGLMDDKVNREKLSKLVRFHSSYNVSEITSLDKYIGNFE
jgi:HSP90 family molecular chaperone